MRKSSITQRVKTCNKVRTAVWSTEERANHVILCDLSAAPNHNSHRRKDSETNPNHEAFSSLTSFVNTARCSTAAKVRSVTSTMLHAFNETEYIVSTWPRGLLSRNPCQRRV